jgi:hypothetical protein
VPLVRQLPLRTTGVPCIGTFGESLDKIPYFTDGTRVPEETMFKIEQNNSVQLATLVCVSNKIYLFLSREFYFFEKKKKKSLF